MKRQKSILIVQRNQVLLEQIKQLKSDHPFWGYRRIWSYLKFREEIPVNKKRIYRLMQHEGLLVTRETRLRAKRGPYKPKPRAEYPNQIWGIDMTKVKLPTWGWLYLVVVLDWYTKEIVGCSLGLQSKTEDWLKTLNQAVMDRFPRGIRESLQNSLCLISDNGCQPTSKSFMKNCQVLGIKQIFTTWSNPKGNSDTERVIRTIKEDLFWSYDWDNPFDLDDRLKNWVFDYNSDYPHQSLNNFTPKQFYENHMNKELVLT